jgi:hypothetical protein
MSQGQQMKAEMQAKYLILVRWQALLSLAISLRSGILLASQPSFAALGSFCYSYLLLHRIERSDKISHSGRDVRRDGGWCKGKGLKEEKWKSLLFLFAATHLLFPGLS